jgi:hypothetical protein
MNIRQAILRAADHIESTPKEFNFQSVYIPDGPGCGTPGCALGWIGHFAGYDEQRAVAESGDSATVLYIGRKVLGVKCEGHMLNRNEFYARMDTLAGGWQHGAVACARGLRLYADKYHPAESRALIPASVRAIFTMTPEQLQREFQQPTAESLMAEFDRTIAALKR